MLKSGTVKLAVTCPLALLGFTLLFVVFSRRAFSDYLLAPGDGFFIFCRIFMRGA